MKRAYDMRKRAASSDATRRHIAMAARKLFMHRWYDDVSIADVARAARVSVATVTRLFPTKAQLHLVAIVSDPPAATRRSWEAGRIDQAIDILVDAWEETGAWGVRTHALATRMPELEPIVQHTRAMQRAWLELVCATHLPLDPVRHTAVLDAVDVATDIHAIWMLRHGLKRTVAETKAHLTFVVQAILRAGGEDQAAPRRAPRRR